jgi:hypothetical protein
MKASIDRISRDHLVLVPLDPTEQRHQWSRHIVVYSVLVLVTVAIVAIVLTHS